MTARLREFLNLFVELLGVKRLRKVDEINFNFVISWMRFWDFHTLRSALSSTLYSIFVFTFLTPIALGRFLH